MARSRHVFVSKDGHPLPEWLKLSGQVECVAADGWVPAALAAVDIIWIRLPAGEAMPERELIRRAAAAARTVVMADIPEDGQALSAFDAGARGYCNSHSNSKALKLIAGVVRDGGLWIGESLMQRMVIGIGSYQQGRGAAGNEALLARLTAREREVAEAIAGGASNKEIARLLQISERTVKAHVSAIFNKLAVRDRLQLTLKIRSLE